MIVHVVYGGGSIEAQQRIDGVVGRLPHEVQEFVRSHCVFLSVGESNGGGLAAKLSSIWPQPTFGDPAPIADRWFLVFSEESIVEANSEDADSLVAHEIAHAFMNDDGQRPHEDADERAREWGFRGYGANPHNFDESA